MRYIPYEDIQKQTPVCYCAKCRGEIYFGNTCYPYNGWQVLCPECYEEEYDNGVPEYAGMYLNY